jgi:hypothetical protein
MGTRRGNLGFGAISSGPLSGPHATPVPHPWGGHTAAIKIAGAAVVENADTAAIKIAGAAVIENAPTSAFKIAGAVIVEGEFVPVINPPHTGPVPQRCPVGMAEYTETTGLFDGYLVKGAIPGFETLRSQLRDHEYVRYRVTNSQKEEVGEGWFDWRANTLMRTRFIVPTSGIDWLSGRKILHIIEDYTNDVCEGAVIANSPLSIGIAEYTTTTGVGPYQLRGSVREFFTLRGRIPDGSRVRYRATNIAKEEVSEGVFDAVGNRLLRNRAAIPTAPINWGPGRKLIYIIEK